MRIVVQRVARSSVSVDGKLINETGRGVMVLVGITRDDNSQDIVTLARKLVNLRVFSAPPSDDYFQNLFLSPTTTGEQSAKNGDDDSDENATASPTLSSPFPSSGPFYVAETVSGVKTWAKSVMDIGGDIMIVSQFTLAHVMKGNKPDFHLARGTDEARKMFEQFVVQVNNQFDAFIKEKIPPPQGKGSNKKPQQQVSTQQDNLTSPLTELPKAHRGKVAVGAFGEHMHISMENDGPVTIILDSNLGEAENEKKKEKERQQQGAVVATDEDKATGQ